MVTPLWRFSSPDWSILGTRPVNDRTPARLAKRSGSPSRPRIPAEGHADARSGHHDPLGIGFVVEGLDAVVHRRDLGVQVTEQAHLAGDVGGQLVEVETARGPQLDRLVSGQEHVVGLGLPPGPGWPG